MKSSVVQTGFHDLTFPHSKSQVIHPIVRKTSISHLLLFVGILLPVGIYADAIIVSKAMFASTIAEYYVEDEQVRVELEIGMADLQSFRNILPESIYTQLGQPPVSLEDRLELFLGRDLAIYNDGSPMKGAVVKMGPGTRIKRDAVTGLPLTEDSEEPEVVVLATLIFPFEKQPGALTLAAPAVTGLANIGFVLYHKGIAVNDFRFLSNGYTVNLDWDDPWYSSFSNRQLRRQYFSPMAGFIYVEPYEVRKEIIVRPADIQRRYDLGLEGVETITPEMQAAVKQGIVDYIGQFFPMTIDGELVEAEVDRVNFLERTLRSSIVVDGQNIALLPATVGVIYVAPTQGLPQNVTLEWDLFTERMQMVPASAVDQAGPLPVLLEPDFNKLEWVNFLKFPELPTLTEISQPPDTMQKVARWGQWIFSVIALMAFIFVIRALLQSRKLNRAVVLMLVLATAMTAWSIQTWREVRMDDARLNSLVGNLLHNIYRAFDYRGEERIYDVLAQSVSGDLLNDVYLETRNGLELANQGGAQVKVKNIEMLEARHVGSANGGLQVEARWNVAGSVGHWGHVHQRTNVYHANLSLLPVDGVWKLTSLDILEEERL